MSVLDASVIDTTPGSAAHCPFSPPAGWEGGSGDYVALLRSRYRDLMYGQRMRFTASFRRRGPVRIAGPFAKEAAEVLHSIIMKRNS